MVDNELAAVRAIRRDISRECGDDPERVFDYYEDIQARIKESSRYEFVTEPIQGTTPLLDSAK